MLINACISSLAMNLEKISIMQDILSSTTRYEKWELVSSGEHLNNRSGGIYRLDGGGLFILSVAGKYKRDCQRSFIHSVLYSCLSATF
jgi:hypothetical protein